jgi:hypothetical protein
MCLRNLLCSRSGVLLCVSINEGVGLIGHAYHWWEGGLVGDSTVGDQ